MGSTKLNVSVGAATSPYKIQCKTSSVLIGDREFLSATEALEAYLCQYENQGLFSSSTTYKRTVNDLFNPKSVLHMTAERSLQTGVRATEKELKLADTKESINESFQNMKKSVTLQAEAKKKYYRKQRERVEQALNKSQELLNEIEDEHVRVQAPNCPSDIGSLNTEVLLSIDPVQPNWKSKHVYGYKRPRNRRAKTMSSIQIAHDMMGLDKKTDELTGKSPEKQKPSVKFQEGLNDSNVNKKNVSQYDDDVSQLLRESPNNSRLSRSPTKKTHERSRSVSPSILKHERKLFESGIRAKPIPDYYTDFNVSESHKTPSWVDTLNMSDVSDTDWKKRDFTTSRPPPSWINDMDTSDITASVVSPIKPAKTLAFQDLLRPIPVINTQDSSYNSDVNDTLPPPGLTYRDLVGDSSKLNNTQTPARPGSPTLSDKLKNLKSKTTAALDRYHERQQELESPSKMSASYHGKDVPRCSSLDTQALLAGIPPPGKSDITGASPIVPGDNDSTVTGRGSPSKPGRRPRSPDTDIVLNGDRPWEQTASYKAPVSVQNISKGATDNELTYSGGSQPGSLEALKNMIFKLQQEAIHTDSEDEGSRNKISERVRKLQTEAASLGIPVPAGEKPPGDIPALKGYDFKGEPGGQSLQKALTHLDRLKTLVSTTQQDEGQTGGGTGRVTPLCADMEQTDVKHL